MEIQNPPSRVNGEMVAALCNLAPSGATLRAIVDAMPAMVWLGDDEGRIRYFNEQFYSFTGVRREDDDGFAYRRIIHPDDAHKPLHALQSIKQRRDIELEVRHRAADGSYRWYLVRGVPITLDDGSVTYIGTNTDIDDRKRAEEGLRETEAEFRTLSELIPQLVSISNPDGRIVFANQQFYDFTGTKREDDDGFLWMKVMHPDDLQVIMPQLGKTLAPGDIWQMEIRYRTGDGEYKWFLVRAVATGGDSSKIFCTATDIDEQKRLSDEIRESEAHLRILAEAIPHIVWTADKDGAVTFINQRYFEYTGLSVEQSTNGGWQLLIHPDDLPSYTAGWSSSLTTGDTFECTFRLKRAVGIRSTNGYRQHLCRAVALRGSSGSIVQWFGTWTDVEGRTSL